MAGESKAPYRVPCFLSVWPGSSTLTLCGGQHIVDNERRVPTHCNAATVGVTPTYVDEGSCGSGAVWNNGNCYQPCPVGNATGLVLDGAIGVGNTVVSVKVGWTGTLYQGDIVKFGTDATVYIVADTTYLIAGNYFTINAPGMVPTSTPDGTPIAIVTPTYGGVAIRDYSSCHKKRWKAVRAIAYWHGKNGFGTEGCNGCPECESRTTRYLRVDVVVSQTGPTPPNEEYPLGGTATWTYVRAVEASVVTGLVSEPAGGCSDSVVGTGDITTIPSGYFTQALINGSWDCGPQVPVGGDYGLQLAALNTLLAEACEGDGTASYSIDGVVYAVEITGTSETSASFSLEQSSGGLGVTWDVSWELSQPYTLAEVVESAYGLANSWDISDDIEYPWRDGPYIQYHDDFTGYDYHNPIPLVMLRSLPPQPMQCPVTCGGLVSCEDGIHDPCPYDGATIGGPLPHGHGVHYGFWKKDCSSYDIGWNPGYGLPSTATWWTHDPDVDSNAATFPTGGWVHVDSAAGIVTVQKWCETKEVNTSYNFFRPCGADDRGSWGSDYKAICGRVAIASATLDTGTHVLTVTLSEAASNLVSADSVDFVKYGGDFTETVDDGDSKASPDSAGYAVTVVDATHFTVASIASVPDATHVKSHGAPHFKWNDDNRKGDFVWCKQVNKGAGCGSDPANVCEAGCLPFSPCHPAVAAVLCGTETNPYPETFGNADVKALEYGISERVLWKPRMSEVDPTFGGEDYVESICPDALPDGAPALPSGFSFLGCGSLPAARPAAAMRGLGDAVAVVAQPIARALDNLTSKLPKKFRTDLTNCQGCHGKGGRQERLNKAFPFQT